MASTAMSVTTASNTQVGTVAIMPTPSTPTTATATAAATKRPSTPIAKKEELIAGLPTVLDIGGQLFDLKSIEDVSSGFYGRETFRRTFHPLLYPNLRVEYLLRTYLFVGQDMEHLVLTEEDYVELMKILTKRVKQLHDSQAYRSSVVKNIPIRRYEAGLLNVIETLKKGRQLKTVTAPKLTDDQLFQVILELSWYLANPDHVPKEIDASWKKVLEDVTDKQRLGDILELIRTAEEGKGLRKEEHPLQYFRKLDMDEVVESETLEEAKKRVVDMTALVRPAPITAGMSDRLKALVMALKVKGYIDDAEEKAWMGEEEESWKKSRNGLATKLPGHLMGAVEEEEKKGEPDEEKKREKEQEGGGRRSRSRSRSGSRSGSRSRRKSKGRGKSKGRHRTYQGGEEDNPTNRGKSKVISTLAVPLGQAILPVFRYLQILFDPVYSMLEQASTRSVKRAVMPHLLLLLHLCNEFHLPPAGKTREFGLYHLKNASSELVVFLKEQLAETEQYIMGEITTEESRKAFQKQLFYLPKVRLRSLVRNNGGLPTMADEQHSVFHIQFFVVGQNLKEYDEATFLTKNPRVSSTVWQAIHDAWQPDQVFFAFTRPDEVEAIPFRFFEVDYEGLNVNETGVTVGKYGAFDALVEKKLLPEDKTLNDLAEITPYAIYNDAEVALSVLMALKERMPK